MNRLQSIVARTMIAALASTVAYGETVGDSPLLQAAKNNDAAAVRSIVNQGVDVNTPAPDGATALHWAAYRDNEEAVKLLIEAGADVRTANRYGATPLSLASTNRNADLVKLLLDAGADANERTPEGETALMTAARAGDVAVVKQLLAHGAESNLKEGWRGQTALMWAAAEGHVGVVEALLEAGSDMHLRSDEGFTPLLFAVRQGQTEVVESLLKAGADPNEIYHAPAVEEGDMYRRASSGMFPKPRTGTSALGVAVANAHYELAAMLLDRGADPNAAEQGWTALHTISNVRNGGQGNNTPSPEGSGSMGSLEFVRYMAEHGANLDARVTSKVRFGESALNHIGSTPFLLAARTADAPLMRLLAELGADPLLPNADNSTPLMVAAGLGTRSPGEDAGTEKEAYEAVKLALELGNDINAVDDNGETAMHGAAYKQFPSVVRLLADSGADMAVWNQENKHGWTPLRIAAGVFRTSNFRFSDATAAELREIMTAAGASVELEPGYAPQVSEEE